MQPVAGIAGERYALIVSGASGGQEYATQYATWTRDLTTVLIDRMKIDRAHLKVLSDTPDKSTAATAANVRQVLTTVRRTMTRDDLLFVVLIDTEPTMASTPVQPVIRSRIRAVGRARRRSARARGGRQYLVGEFRSSSA
jgi:hypothetical protein